MWIISIILQKMALVRDDKLEQIYKVSTSKLPPSCQADSYGTPTGLHAAADKIGSGEAEGMVFKGRLPIGHFSEFSKQEQASNLITTRIIRLRGLEPGHNQGPNCDSYARYIYMHGSNHEDRIGQPFSGGCIEMFNADILEIFDVINEGDLVWISEQ